MGWASRLNKSPRDGNTPASRRRELKTTIDAEMEEIAKSAVLPKSQMETMLLLTSALVDKKRKRSE